MNNMHSKKAVILSSGGLDSTTVMGIAKHLGYQLYSLSFSYGQRHACELLAAQKVADFFNVKKHLIVDVNMNQIGGSALTDAIDVPKYNQHVNTEYGSDETIPVTYVPARNTIFLSYALAWAEVLTTGNIFIGVNAVDYSGYPDCRPQFISAFETMANLATKAGVEKTTAIKIHTPLIHLSKSEIIRKGIDVGVDYSITHSCYDPSSDGKACGQCDSCILRLKGFADAGIKDPVPYINMI